MKDLGLWRLREVNWRIVLPIVIVLGAMCYLVYQVVTAGSGREVQQTLSVTLQRFGKTLLERDTERLSRYCSRPAAEQCTALLTEIAARERRDPTFRFARFTMSPDTGRPGTQSTSINLVDNQRRIFLVLECQVTQMPDESWKITEVRWHSLVGP